MEDAIIKGEMSKTELLKIVLEINPVCMIIIECINVIGKLIYSLPKFNNQPYQIYNALYI